MKIISFLFVLSALLCLSGPFSPEFKPWDAVGGCGVGGSGGAGGGASGGVRWLGRGVTGGLLDAEIMTSVSGGENFGSQSVNARLSHLLGYRNTVGLSLPWIRKSGENRPGPSFLPRTEVLSEHGDLGLDYSRKFGSEYQGSVSMSLGVPLARNNMRRKSLHEQLPPLPPIPLEGFLPPDLQLGTGLYSLGFTFEYSIERDRGPIIFTLGYSQSFSRFSRLAVSFSRGGDENGLYDDKNLLARDLGIDSAFNMKYGTWHDVPPPWEGGPVDFETWDQDLTIRREFFSRNRDDDREGPIQGDYFGNAVNGSAAWGYRTENFVHSAQLAYVFKITPDWFVRRPDADYINHSEKVVDQYLEKVYVKPVYRDNTRHVWSLGYGLEISFMRFPVFVGTAATLDGRGDFQSVSANLGVRGSFF